MACTVCLFVVRCLWSGWVSGLWVGASVLVVCCCLAYSWQGRLRGSKFGMCLCLCVCVWCVELGLFVRLVRSVCLFVRVALGGCSFA